MAVVRTVIDIRTKSELDDQEINKIRDSLEKYAFGVVVELNLDGNEEVNGSVHNHKSTERYACEDCNELANDEVN